MSSGTGPVSLMTIDVMDILTMMTQMLPSLLTQMLVSMSKKVMMLLIQTTPILKKLRETPSLLLERSLLQALLMIRIQKLKCMTLCLMM